MITNLKEREKTYKRSRQREALLSLLRSVDTHPTAHWLYMELRKSFPEISQGTVYRNLNVLAQQNLVKIINAGEKFARFDANILPHSHLICRICGKMQDIHISTPIKEAKDVELMSGFKIEGQTLDFWGICPECQANSHTPSN